MSNKNLVIVESPAKAKTIQKFLWKDFEVTTSMGHICDLPQKKMWVDIENNFEPFYEISPWKKKVVNELKKEAKNKEKIYLATDEDREWEAIAWHLAEILNLDKNKTPRIVFHEITKSALQDAIKSPRSLDENLVNAQQWRRVLDRIVGFQISPILWEKVKRGLSAGRVQSVAVKLVVEKERERQKFVPKEYWYLKTQLKYDKKTFWAFFNKISNKKKILEKEESVKEVLKALKIKSSELKESKDQKTGNKNIELEKKIDFELKDKQKKESKKTPPPPFITSTLQQEASRKLWYWVKQTMMIAQKLYENWHITYMRTDSVSLSSKAINSIAAYIKKYFGNEYSKSRQYKTKSWSAQEAHEAIRPTNINKTSGNLKLTWKEAKLYFLIWSRCIASQMSEAKIEKTTYTFFPKIDSSQEWITKWEQIIFPGFLKIYEEWSDEEDNKENFNLPKIEKWEQANSKQFQALQNFTKPPARYTEATLVKKLESEWIGRPSTYAPTISTVIDRWYIQKEWKHLIPTEIAFIVTDYLTKYFCNLMDYSFTAKMEEKLDSIAEGKQSWKTMLKNFYKNFVNELEKAKKWGNQHLKIWEKCPKCWWELIYKFSRIGKFIWCENYPDCKYTRQSEEEKEMLEKLKEKYEWEKCPEWGQIVVKIWRYWPFLASSEYPKVKRIKAIPDEKQEELEEKLGGMKCDKCEKWTMHVKKPKKWRKGSYFLWCSEYPDCNNLKSITAKGEIKEVKNKSSNSWKKSSETKKKTTKNSTKKTTSKKNNTKKSK